MSAAYAQYFGDGVTRKFAVPFPFFAREHVKVRVDAVEQEGIGWLNDGLLETSYPPPQGSLVDVRRETPTGTSPVDFEDGSILTEVDLDLLAKYSGYLAEESRDYVVGALRLGPDGSYNADGRRMSNLADGTLPGDAMTQRQFSAQVSGPITTLRDQAQAAAQAASLSQTSAAVSAALTTAAVESASVRAISADLTGLNYMGSDLGAITDSPLVPGNTQQGSIKTVADDIASVRTLAARPDVLLSGPGLVAAVDLAKSSATSAAASAEIALGASAAVVDAGGSSADHYLILGATATGAVVRKTSTTLTFKPSTGLLSAPKLAGDGSALTNVGVSALATNLDLGSI
ncbi:phage tail fiber protein [Variovorax sp. V15]|uniref:phage tail fiber domain-containing protein n=1 Tax=Variovorax sp. V15 TaxID=3065952 RepID=UPI0034E8E4D7